MSIKNTVKAALVAAAMVGCSSEPSITSTTRVLAKTLEGNKSILIEVLIPSRVANYYKPGDTIPIDILMPAKDGVLMPINQRPHSDRYYPTKRIILGGSGIIDDNIDEYPEGTHDSLIDQKQARIIKNEAYTKEQEKTKKQETTKTGKMILI